VRTYTLLALLEAPEATEVAPLATDEVAPLAAEEAEDTTLVAADEADVAAELAGAAAPPAPA
jgi:hypothetical protein